MGAPSYSSSSAANPKGRRGEHTSYKAGSKPEEVTSSHPQATEHYIAEENFKSSHITSAANWQNLQP